MLVIKIFNALEIEAFDSPPVFSSTERKEYREELLTAIKNGSVVSWQHINLHGEYDFSDEKLQDSVGLNLPEILGFGNGKNRASQKTKKRNGKMIV